MFNNQYDTDCITWSPQGRIFQIEYAMEAVKQGTPVVAMRSKTHAVICAFKRAKSDLAGHQKKIFKLDDHMCIGISGITSDARVLCEYMRNECLNHSYAFGAPMPLGRLVAQVGDKSQVKTQNSSKRPYGVGLLVAGYDENGPHIFETCPSGNYWEYRAQAIGGRSQAAKTYLERHFETFDDVDLQALVQHALEAMNATTASDTSLTTKNTSVAVVGKDQKFKEMPEEEVQQFIDKLQKKREEPDVAMGDAPGGGDGGAPAADAPAPMDTSA